MSNQNQNHKDQHQKDQHHYHYQQPQQSIAGGIFWGLFLFFIVLPIGSCAACATCGAIGTATHHR